MSTGSASQTGSHVVLGSIDRSELTFCLRPRTQIRAALTSVVVCAAVPVAALICLIAGCIAFGACWLLILVLAAASYGLVLAGGVMILASFNEETRGAAAGGIPLGILGFYLITVFSPWFKPIKDAADTAFAGCQQVADFLYTEIFIGMYVYAWSWSLLFGALLAAAAVLATVWLLGNEARIKRSLFQIRYTCPAADCTYQGVPFFRCPGCSAVLGDLQPTVFGVLGVRCSQCSERLPTCDLTGRLRLEKQCPQCSVDLEHPAFGRLSELHVVFAGASSSGKSNLMISAIRDLERTIAPAFGLRVQFTNAAEEQEFRNRCAMMDEGRVLEKTISSANPAAFNLSIEDRRGKGTLMYVYDTDGSDFETEDRLLRHAFHEYTRGVVLVIDPFAERRVVSELGIRGNGELSPVSPATADISTVLGRLISRFEHVLAERAERTIPVPVAVVVTKVDACDLEHRFGGVVEFSKDHRSVANAARHAASRSRRVRQILRDCGLGNVINNLESRFHPVRYFPVSALGRSFRPDDGTPFASRGVWAPFLWVCYQSGAVSGLPTVVSLLRNAWHAFVESLHAKAGADSAIVAWAFTVCISAMLFTTLWHFVGFVATTAISGGLIGIVFLAGAIAKGGFSWDARE